MAQTTRQIQRTGGSDKAAGSNKTSTVATSQRETSPAQRVQKTTTSPVTSTTTRGGATRVTTENNFGQTSTSAEDFSFTLAFSVIIKSSLPCEEQV